MKEIENISNLILNKCSTICGNCTVPVSHAKGLPEQKVFFRQKGREFEKVCYVTSDIKGTYPLRQCIRSFTERQWKEVFLNEE